MDSQRFYTSTKKNRNFHSLRHSFEITNLKKIRERSARIAKFSIAKKKKRNKIPCKNSIFFIHTSGSANIYSHRTDTIYNTKHPCYFNLHVFVKTKREVFYTYTYIYIQGKQNDKTHRLNANVNNNLYRFTRVGETNENTYIYIYFSLC